VSNRPVICGVERASDRGNAYYSLPARPASASVQSTSVLKTVLRALGTAADPCRAAGDAGRHCIYHPHAPIQCRHDLTLLTPPSPDGIAGYRTSSPPLAPAPLQSSGQGERERECVCGGRHGDGKRMAGARRRGHHLRGGGRRRVLRLAHHVVVRGHVAVVLPLGTGGVAAAGAQARRASLVSHVLV
jgi:hypothetical protein